MFTLLDDGIAYVKDDVGVLAASVGRPQGIDGQALVPSDLEGLIIEAGEECPGECIFVEA